MANFGVLGNIPGLGGFVAGQHEDQQQQVAQLQRAGALQGILANVQKQQAQQQEMAQQQELRGILSKSSGDPAVAVKSLLQAGTPASLSLAAKLHSLMPKTEGQSIGSGGLRLPDGTIIPPVAGPVKPQTPSNVARLMSEMAALPEGDPRRAVYQNAIRKESETAKQISPTIVMPQPVSGAIVQDKDSPTGWSHADQRTGRITLKGAPPPAGDPSRSYGNAAAGGAAKDDVAQHDVAIAAASDLPKINNLVNTIKTSQAITGLGADILKNVERAKVLLANDKKAGKVVSDTEYLDALMGSEVFSMIKPLGIGARGLDTPSEREFLRKVMTGEVSLNKDTLLRMAETRKAVTERAVQRWNSRVKSGELDPFFRATGRSKNEVGASQEPMTPQVPAPTVPSAGTGRFKITPVN